MLIMLQMKFGFRFIEPRKNGDENTTPQLEYFRVREILNLSRLSFQALGTVYEDICYFCIEPWVKRFSSHFKI